MIEQKDIFQLTCVCGCDTGFVFRYMDGEIFVSLVNGFYYANQIPIRSDLELKRRVLKGKDPYIAGITVNQETLAALLQWLHEHDCINMESDNNGYLRVIDFGEDIKDLFCISLYPTGFSRWDVLCGKLYRASEIILHAKEKRRLIRAIEKAIDVRG